MSKILKISNLYKNYNTKKMEIEALKNVNIEINEGDFLGIVGPSGCGKSTLLSIIGGLESITKGSIEKSKCKGRLYRFSIKVRRIKRRKK